MKNAINTIKNALHPGNVNFNVAFPIIAAIIAAYWITLKFELIALFIPSAIAAIVNFAYCVYFIIYTIKSCIENAKEED